MIATRDSERIDIVDLPAIEPDAPGDCWRVVLVPLGITPRRSRLLSEHASESEALDAAVRAARDLTGWTADVWPPAACEA